MDIVTVEDALLTQAPDEMSMVLFLRNLSYHVCSAVNDWLSAWNEPHLLGSLR